MPTDFGTFKDEEYSDIKTRVTTGVSMKLSFEPNDKVDATEIGLTQIVKVYKNNTPFPLLPEFAKKLVTQKGASEGYMTDRAVGETNPIMGAENLDIGQDLSKTKNFHTDEMTGQPRGTLGWRSDPKTKPPIKAEMIDRPAIETPKPPKDAGQVFETTALAIEGAQKGTYYGSVSWGWTLDSAGKYQRQPLKLESKGDPTSKFFDAAKLWNAFEMPAKVKPTGKPKEYRVEEPLVVRLKIGTDEDYSLTLPAGSLLTLTGAEADRKLMVSIGQNVSFSAGHIFAKNIPIDRVDEKTMTVKTDTAITVGGASVTVKAGTTLRDYTFGEQFQVKKDVTGWLAQGSVVLPPDTEASIAKAAVTGVKDTKLPVPAGKRKAGATTIRRAAIPTDLGVFKDESYTAIDDDHVKGVDMTLSFTPGDKVDATKIGMAQSAKAVWNNKVNPVHPDNTKKMVSGAGASKGYQIDQLVSAGETNPIYQAQNLASGEDLSASHETPLNTFNHFGWRSASMNPPEREAEMHDQPYLKNPPKDSSQIFETTALAIDGAQKGTYFGSVSWGWTLDSAGKYHKHDLKLESKGNPTSKFLDAAKVWNEFELPAKVEPTGEPNEYRVKTPFEVNGKFGALTLAVNSLLKLTGSEAGSELTMSIGPIVSLIDSHILVKQIPMANIDEKTMTVKTDTTVDLGGIPVRIKAGSKLRDFSTFEFHRGKVVTGFLGEGAIVLPPGTEASVVKAAAKGGKTTKLPIPRGK